MKIRRNCIKGIVLVIWMQVMGAVSAGAQWRVVPIESSSDYSTPLHLHNARTSGEDSLQITLPFWDDFSGSFYDPDTSMWLIGAGTSVVSPGAGVNPPTVNVAVFDGWNRLGEPYSTTQLDQGAGDSLVSRYIDLDAIAPEDTSSVYMSFFWQKRGLGELPDEVDSLALFFVNRDKEFVRVWGVKGSDVMQTDRFYQEIIRIEQDYFDPYFQFRFRSYGRLSGGFDSWNIDYVYLNYNRHPGDTVYEDRALTTIPGSFLRGYTAMPYSHFITDVAGNTQNVAAGFYNLDRLVQPIEYSVFIRDTTGIFDQMNDLTVLDPNPAGFERRTIFSDPVDPAAFDIEHDTIALKLETVFFINSGDSVQFDNAVDYRLNDTTSSTVQLDRVLAYDDGTAEWAAGLSQGGNKLAYRFVASRPDIITDVQFYFPTFSGGYAGNTLTLIIWDNLREGVEGRLLTELHIIQGSDSLNDYKTYKLGRAISVQDTFYIGYQQEVNDFFAIGLDKNTDSGSEVFINTGGAWEQNQKIEGSLMIRPVFGFKKAVGLPHEPAANLRLYPNPTSGAVNVEGGFSIVGVTNVLGRDYTSLLTRRSDERWDLKRLPAGLYLVILEKEDYTIKRKILISR